MEALSVKGAICMGYYRITVSPSGYKGCYKGYRNCYYKAIRGTARSTCWIGFCASSVSATSLGWEVLGATAATAETEELGYPAPDDLCYVQFTSGSTGKPKGVLCEHRQAAWYALSKAVAEGVDESSCLMLTAAFTFDPCQGDIFCALVSGAVLALVPRVRLLQDLTEVLRQSQASHLCATPALWRLVDPDAELPHLWVLALGGEKMPPAIIQKWAPLLHLRNVYGVTEATVYQTAMQMTAETRPQTAGWPLPGVQLKIVAWEEPEEEEEEPEEGEICLSGPGLARGYLGLPALTEERFRRLPGGGRQYHTGDSGRFAASLGSHPCLEVLGRRDSQVKLNGERIELGEVEQLLGMSPLISQCAAMPWGDQASCLHLPIEALKVTRSFNSFSQELSRVSSGCRNFA